VLTLDLVRITDTSGRVTGIKNGVTYQALTYDELDRLYDLQADYTYISREFDVELIGKVQIPSIGNDDEDEVRA
jgi:hypothetical protein